MSDKPTPSARPRVVVTVSGPTGVGKSRIAHEIHVALKAAGVAVEWANIDDPAPAAAGG